MKKQSISKEFFLHLGLIASLYTTVASLMIFAFTVINLQFPDTLFSVGNAREQITLSLSFLIVAFPIFIFISKKVYKDLDIFEGNRELWIRKWSLSLTLFLLVLMFAITIVILLQTFLSGEITTRFSLKVLVTLLLSGFAFWFYLRDYQGFFFGELKLRKVISNVVVVVISISILLGLAVAGSPGEMRNMKLDETRVSNLSEIQREVTMYWQNNEVLPESLDDISNELSYFVLPIDPETEKGYVYNVIGEKKFQLCADFSTSNLDEINSVAQYGYYGINPEEWKHDAGRYCFDREIDEKLIRKAY